MPKFSQMSLLDLIVRLLGAGVLLVMGSILLSVLAVLLLVRELICSLLMIHILSKRPPWLLATLRFLTRCMNGIHQGLVSAYNRVVQ